jgi:hypothetical protein
MLTLDPTFAFVWCPCYPTLNFEYVAFVVVVCFWGMVTMVTLNALLTSSVDTLFYVKANKQTNNQTVYLKWNEYDIKVVIYAGC